jgi:hypothetical protein
MSLSQTILSLVDNPNAENRDAFYKMFAMSRVGVRIPEDFGPISPGQYVTTDTTKLAVPFATSPDGTPMLVVIADVGELAKREAGSRFVELDAQVVIKMAMERGAGIIVQASTREQQGWAGIPRQDVALLRHEA